MRIKKAPRYKFQGAGCPVSAAILHRRNRAILRKRRNLNRYTRRAGHAVMEAECLSTNEALTCKKMPHFQCLHVRLIWSYSIMRSQLANSPQQTISDFLAQVSLPFTRLTILFYHKCTQIDDTIPV